MRISAAAVGTSYFSRLQHSLGDGQVQRRVDIETPVARHVEHRRRARKEESAAREQCLGAGDVDGAVDEKTILPVVLSPCSRGWRRQQKAPLHTFSDDALRGMLTPGM